MIRYVSMTKKELLISIFKKYFPYVIVVAAAILSCFIYFWNGLAGGDDIAFHLSMTNDVLYGFDHGYFGYSTNHLHMGGFALFNFAFYGPVTHYGAAIFTYIFRGWGATPSDGLKFMVFASAILGGIYMYKLALKMSKGRQSIATISAVLFVFMPYRIFCALARCAFAESIAMALIPMVFYGAYSFIHDKEYRVEPYVAFASGAILIILAHAFTGLITVMFGVIYVLFNIKGVIAKFRDKRALISLGAAIVIIVFCVLFYVLNSYFYESSELYNLSDDERQWTTYEHMAEETSRAYPFSGFINLVHISNNSGAPEWKYDTVSSLLFSSFIYILSMVAAVLIDHSFKNLKKNEYYRHPVACVAAFVFPLLFQVRTEIYLAIAISLVLYFFIAFLVKKLPNNEENKPLYKNIDLYFLSVSLLICIVLICVPYSWKFVPSIMYKGQFAWRMWSITAFLATMLVALILSNVKINKAILVTASIITCGIMTITMGTTEKRVIFEHKPEVIILNDGEEYAINTKYSGAQNEMVPQVFYDGEYKPQTNSLYYSVRNRLWSQNNFFYTAEDYIKPAFLQGTGDVSIYEYNSPNNKFHVDITSETALVQFPQFYYAEYTIVCDGKTISKAQNVDGLIAFSLNQGKYDVTLSFKPSKAYQATIPLFYVGLVLLVSGGVFGCVYRLKLMKKEDKPQEE